MVLCRGVGFRSGRECGLWGTTPDSRHASIVDPGRFVEVDSELAAPLDGFAGREREVGLGPGLLGDELVVMEHLEAAVESFADFHTSSLPGAAAARGGSWIQRSGSDTVLS